MSIRAKQLRPYVDTMTISQEAKRQLVEALANEESFIIHPAGERADELSKTVRVVQLAQQDFDVVVAPSAAASLNEFFQSLGATGVNFSPMLIVHPDEPVPIAGALEIKQKEKRESKLIRTWWQQRVIEGAPKLAGFWYKALNYEIHLLAEIAASDPVFFTVEERSGYRCQWGWTTKNWRLQDGTVDGKNTSVGCYSVGEDDAGPHFEIRTEQLRGLVVHLCREHFVEFFPKFAEAMGVEWQATASAEKRSEGGAL